MTNLMGGRRSSSTDNSIVDLTGIGTTTGSSSNNNSSSSPYFCNFCDVALIKKMDDPGDNKRYICPSCANIQDPLKVDEFNKLKHAERGQNIRSNNSVGGNEGSPFAEMFNSSNNASTTNNDKASSLRRQGTQLSRALSQTDINVNNNNDPDGPNEEANLRSQNMRILRTETTYPESGRKVTKTFDDDY